MNLHTNGHDCASTGEITISDFHRRYLFTTGYLGGGEVKACAWAHWGEQPVWGRLVPSRAGVLSNAYHLHGPTCWRGERYAFVCYTSAWSARLTPTVRQGLLEMGFHCGDDM